MESKMEVLLSEVEARKNVLFSTLSYDISSKRKRSGWERVSDHKSESINKIFVIIIIIIN